MARIRTIKPEFWTDAALMECSLNARLLFIGTWNFADDEGNLDRSAKQIKARVFPADAIDCEPMLQELLSNGLLMEYSVSGKKYLHIQGFKKHQLVNHPSKPQCPVPEDSSSTTGGLPEDSCLKGREGKGIEEQPPKAPLTVLQTAKPKRQRREKLPETTFDAFIAELKLGGKPVIPADDPIHAWSEKAGISTDLLNLCWAKFKERYTGSEKKYADWRATFRNAVRGNWFRLWYVDDNGNITLTTNGKITEKVAA